MTIPSYEEMMLPLLTLAGDKKIHTNQESLDFIINKFHINSNDAEILLKSGNQTLVSNRVAWARTYLRKAGLLVSEERATFTITELGLEVLQENPLKITDKYLMKFSDFQEFQKRHKPTKTNIGHSDETTKTPNELLEESYLTLRNELADELLASISKCSPSFFERLVFVRP